MRCTFGYSLKQIAVASLFSCFVAGGICVLTSPSAANNAAAVTISVNRTFKGYRLPQVPIAQQSEQNSTSTENLPLRKHTPLGCEPAFSPVTDPARAHKLRRCIT
jgi:hypothetical protein